jgi:hypothetical protein
MAVLSMSVGGAGAVGVAYKVSKKSASTGSVRDAYRERTRIEPP